MLILICRLAFLNNDLNLYRFCLEMTLAKDPVEVLQVKKLLHCVRIEDYDQIRKLCEKGVEELINYNEPHDGLTALILAAVKNNEKMMEFLIQLGAHPNVPDLKVFILSNAKFLLLINFGNSIIFGIKLKKGRTPLMKAAELGHVQAIEILKKAKADATLRDLEGKGEWSILSFLRIWDVYNYNDFG